MGNQQHPGTVAGFRRPMTPVGSERQISCLVPFIKRAHFLPSLVKAPTRQENPEMGTNDNNRPDPDNPDPDDEQPGRDEPEVEPLPLSEIAAQLRLSPATLRYCLHLRRESGRR